MKKLLIVLFVSLISVSFLSLRENQNIKEDSVENVECKIRRCNAIAKSTKKRCKRCVSKEGDYQCYQHKPKLN
tara:strand:- start:603 stop:821 length:219 start_codon:yes stop_codon:yes gene_type:complete